jgi:hypothetical protein
LLEEELQYRVGEGKEFFTSLKYHRTHCSYQWGKMHRAMQMGKKIENKLADYHHTVRCDYVNMQEGDMEGFLTKITVEIMTCRRADIIFRKGMGRGYLCNTYFVAEAYFVLCLL